MSMYGYDFYDYGFSDLTLTRSIDYEDEFYFRRRPPMPPIKTPSSPPEHRHDGTSPLPLGMDWSLPPRIWEGRHTVWPHESGKKWSYCVTVPSWTISPSASGSDTVFFRVQVGIQSPEGITSTREVLRRFNEFLKLSSELKKEFPKKNLPPAPPKRLTRMRSRTVLEERRRALEDWMEKLLSDIKVSRTALVAIFLELEAAARQSFSELSAHESAANPVSSDQFLSATTSFNGSSSSVTFGNESYVEPNIERKESNDMQNDLEELTRKCIELELRLAIEQDARAYAESVTAATIQQNEMLIRELDDVKEQVKSLEMGA